MAARALLRRTSGRGSHLPDLSGSVRALPHRRRRRLLECRPGQTEGAGGQPVSGRGLCELHEAVRAAMAVHRPGDPRRYLVVDKVCPCVMILHGQGGISAFSRGAAPGQDQGDRCGRISDGGQLNAPKLKDIPVLMLFGDYVDQHPRWASFKRSTPNTATPSRRPVARSTGSCCRTSASRATATC